MSDVLPFVAFTLVWGMLQWVVFQLSLHVKVLCYFVLELLNRSTVSFPEP
jgi:hypothetical protein